MLSIPNIVKIIYNEVENFYNEKFKGKPYEEFTDYFYDDRIDDVLKHSTEYYFNLVVKEFDEVMKFLTDETYLRQIYKEDEPWWIFPLFPY